jgi:hypothetical protein
MHIITRTGTTIICFTTDTFINHLDYYCHINQFHCYCYYCYTLKIRLSRDSRRSLQQSLCGPTDIRIHSIRHRAILGNTMYHHGYISNNNINLQCCRNITIINVNILKYTSSDIHIITRISTTIVCLTTDTFINHNV